MPAPLDNVTKNLEELFTGRENIFGPPSPPSLVGEDKLKYQQAGKFFKDFCGTVKTLVEKLKDLGPTKATEQEAEIKKTFEEETKKLEAQKEKLNSRTSPTIYKVFETIGEIIKCTWKVVKVTVKGALDTAEAVGKLATALKDLGGYVKEMVKGPQKGTGIPARL